MDPNTALALYHEARAAGRWTDAHEHLTDLGFWLLDGGFHPADLTEDTEEAALMAARSAIYRWAA